MSRARHNFHEKAEAALNQQINTELQAGYIYKAMAAYFSRDNVSLPGLAQFFKKSSEEENSHADKFIDYITRRGGKVVLEALQAPETEFDDEEKGEALNALEKALALEKGVNQALLELHKVAEESNDPHLSDFLEGQFLEEQVESINTIANYISQLKRVGKGHGTWAWDHELAHHFAKWIIIFIIFIN